MAAGKVKTILFTRYGRVDFGAFLSRSAVKQYLIKMYIYDTTRFAAYRDRWVLAADSSIAHLTSHPSSRPDLTFLAEFSGTQTINESEHLACFDGGNFLLAGNVLKRQDYINFGLALTSACHDTYISTATGIGPEVFQWNTSTLPANQTAFYEKAGFWISDASYDLRPEVIESYYYAYQIVSFIIRAMHIQNSLTRLDQEPHLPRLGLGRFHCNQRVDENGLRL